MKKQIVQFAFTAMLGIPLVADSQTLTGRHMSLSSDRGAINLLTAGPDWEHTQMELHGPLNTTQQFQFRWSLVGTNGQGGNYPEALTLWEYHPRHAASGGARQVSFTEDGITPVADFGGKVLVGDKLGIGTAVPNDKLEISDNGGGLRLSYASEPSLYFLDINTVVSSGVVRYSFDQRNWGTDYPNTLVLDRGRVAIGASDPGKYKLSVRGPTRLGAAMTIGRSGGHYDEIGYGVEFGDQNEQYTYLTSDYAATMRFGYNGGIEFRTAPFGTIGDPMTLSTRAVLTAGGSFLIDGHIVSREAFPSSFAGLELGEFLTPGSFSGIDFHYAGGNPDFSFRLINDSPNVLSLRTLSAGGAVLNVEGKVSAATIELTSDRHRKKNLAAVQGASILERVARLPIYTWQFTNAAAVTNIGPMAQDFKAAFPDIGEDDKHIGAGDGIGVALAAIKGLHELVKEKDTEIAALKRELAGMKQELASVKDTVTDRLAALEKAMATNVQQAEASVSGKVNCATLECFGGHPAKSPLPSLTSFASYLKSVDSAVSLAELEKAMAKNVEQVSFRPEATR